MTRFAARLYSRHRFAGRLFRGRLVVLCALLLIGACASVNSTTWIDAGQTFVLDGSGARAQGFSVDLRNRGRVAVDVVEVSRGGEQTPPRVVAPGARARVAVGPGASLRVRNRGAGQARVDLVLTGNTGVGMGSVASDAVQD